MGKSTSVELMPRFIFYVIAIVCVLTWGVALYLLVVDGIFHSEVVRYMSMVFGISFGSYCYKSACDYKTDIQYKTKIKAH